MGFGEKKGEQIYAQAVLILLKLMDTSQEEMMLPASLNVKSATVLTKKI